MGYPARAPAPREARQVSAATPTPRNAEPELPGRHTYTGRRQNGHAREVAGASAPEVGWADFLCRGTRADTARPRSGCGLRKRVEPASGTGTGHCVTGELTPQDRSGARAVGHRTEVRTAVRRAGMSDRLTCARRAGAARSGKRMGVGRRPGSGRARLCGRGEKSDGPTSCAGGLVAGGGLTPQGRDQDANPATGRVDIGAGAGRFVAGELTPQGCSGGGARAGWAAGPRRAGRYGAGSQTG